MFDYKFNKFIDRFNKNNFSDFVLGVDLGGTSTKICIAGVKDSKSHILYIYDFETKKLDSLNPAINRVLDHAKEKFDLEVDYAFIGAAGVISKEKNFADLTNVSWNIDLKEIMNQTSLKKAFIINDFEAVGYGINLLDENDTLIIRPGNKTDEFRLTKAAIGAGTGLGKSILNFNEKINGYIPLPSEGGHSDLPVYNDFELKLVEFIKKTQEISEPVCYEEILSGRGLVNIYNFLKNQNISEKKTVFDEIEKSNDKPALISKYKNIDETCKKTFELFTRFYGRCAKNFVLDSMANGGLYIAGGIAFKNKEIFSSDYFFEEFISADKRSHILKQIPIYVITNPNVGLYGVCFAAMCKKQGRL
jgi:glucokinase